MSNNLKIFRHQKGLTQKEVAMKANISERYYQYLEKGERKPTILIAKNLAKVLSGSLEDIFTE